MFSFLKVHWEGNDPCIPAQHQISEERKAKCHRLLLLPAHCVKILGLSASMCGVNMVVGKCTLDISVLTTIKRRGISETGRIAFSIDNM